MTRGEVDVAEAPERLANDSDLKLRRRARRALATYRRSGRIVQT